MRETQSWVSALGADHPPLLLPYSEENVPRIRLVREQNARPDGGPTGHACPGKGILGGDALERNWSSASELSALARLSVVI